MNIGSVVLVGAAVAAAMTTVSAQNSKPMSPVGTASAQVLGHWVKPAARQFALGGEAYTDGKWIEVTYGRPLKRGRDVFGSGANYGKDALIGAPIWRAGANVSTRFKTEVPLQIGGKTVPAGEYSLFIDLKENNWTLVVSSWPAQATYDPNNKTALWGAYEYTPDRDVLRVPMKLAVLPNVREQLTWEFLDMTDRGGVLAISWDKTMASVPFTAGA
jgi:hypothetical protein